MGRPERPARPRIAMTRNKKRIVVGTVGSILVLFGLLAMLCIRGPRPDELASYVISTNADIERAEVILMDEDAGIYRLKVADADGSQSFFSIECAAAWVWPWEGYFDQHAK